MKSLATKITIGIVIITTIILVFISIFSISRAQSEFQYATVQFFDGKDVLFVQTLPPHVQEVIDKIKQDFTDRLIGTVFVAALLATLLAVIAGMIFSIIITKPLLHIRQGIADLKKNKYKSKLSTTGQSEFDEVIDEFNSLSEDLEYQETLRKDLISDVSHELKTPLTSLIGQVQGMRDGVLDINDQRLELVQHNVERLTDLVNMLQEYTTLRSATIDINKENVNVKKVLDYIKSNLPKDTKIKLEYKVDKDLEIVADKNLLERVIQNIVDNSIKYSQGTKILIMADQKSIIISDNGIGIPEEHIKKIFERFYRVEKSRNRKTGGLGLGLALVKEIVEAHGWEIEAINNQDKGVSFVIKLVSS